MELNFCRGPPPEQAVGRLTIFDLAGHKWPETMFPWNLNSKPSSALVKVHQHQSISMQYSSFYKALFPTKKLKNSWQVLFVGLSSMRADTCVWSCFLWRNLNFDSFMILNREKKNLQRMLFFSCFKSILVSLVTPKV